MKLGHDNWIQIPCAPRYEINDRGVVRNIESGRILKGHIRKDYGHDKRYSLVIGGRKKLLVNEICFGWRTGLFPNAMLRRSKRTQADNRRSRHFSRHHRLHINSTSRITEGISA